jgi:hypothetical protein
VHASFDLLHCRRPQLAGLAGPLLQIGALSGFASFYQCHIAKVNEQGFHIKMGIASYHAPGNERYKKFKNWGYGWVTRTSVYV